MGLKNYDPKKIILTFKGHLVSGYMDGTFLTVERNSDGWVRSSGADGKQTRTRMNDRSGLVTLTLQAESPSNDSLSAFALADELSGVGYGRVMVKDLNGNTLASGNEAWIRKLPNAEFADSASGREWVIEVADLELNLGGAVL